MTENQTPFAAYGDRANPNVRELQHALSGMGLYAGEITGTFDDATYRAYRQACARLQRPVSRDAQGRLVVTLGDFEALEQQAGSHTGSQPAYPSQLPPPEDDFAKRPAPPEDNSAKRPVSADAFTKRADVPQPRPARPGHGWKLLLIAVAVMVVAGVVLWQRGAFDEGFMDDRKPTSNAGSNSKPYQNVAPQITYTPTPVLTATPVPDAVDNTSQEETIEWEDNWNTSTACTTPPTNTPAASLELGSTGSEVRRLQERLKELGYYKGAADGDFGEGTENAVKAFQQQNGLTADGKAGPRTIERLYSSSAKRAPASNTPAPTPRTTATPTPKPTITPCPHDEEAYLNQVYIAYHQVDNNSHSYETLEEEKCGLCDEVIGQFYDKGTEAHSYHTGGSICIDCGYVKTTPTPKPTATPTPKPAFNTTIYGGKSKMLRNAVTVPVYSGPGTGYYRGANGKAECSLHREFFLWGYENGWYMISYETNAGASRVGYVEDAQVQESFSASNLYFAYKTARTTEAVKVTDDPDGKQGSIASLSSGASVTYLATYGNWYYVECYAGGKSMRGFIPVGTLKAN